jgi:hypothetical protein
MLTSVKLNYVNLSRVERVKGFISLLFLYYLQDNLQSALLSINFITTPRSITVRGKMLTSYRFYFHLFFLASKKKVIHKVI